MSSPTPQDLEPEAPVRAIGRFSRGIRDRAHVLDARFSCSLSRVSVVFRALPIRSTGWPQPLLLTKTTMPVTASTATRVRPDQEIALPPAVAEVLRQAPDEAFRSRLLRVLQAATRAIVRLREIDLTRIEHLASSGEGSDLALWEEVAPAVGASIGDVTTLLATIDEEFPTPEESVEDDLDLAFGPSDSDTGPQVAIATTPEEKAKEAESSIQGIAASLRAEVSRFGQRVRNPTIVADRWNLLVDLQEFRGKCRAGIGELVFAACSAFQPLTRALIVPEYAQDLEESICVRHAVTTLTRAVGPLNSRVQMASPEQQRGPLLAIQRELDHFRASRGYSTMRAGDKRFVIAFARGLADIFNRKAYGREGQQHVEGFAKFLDSLAVINRREILMNHDREAFAECGTLLEQASHALAFEGPEPARIRLAEALDVARRLFGRDRFLDDYLVTRLRWPLEFVADHALSQAIEELRRCLAEAGSHTPAASF